MVKVVKVGKGKVDRVDMLDMLVKVGKEALLLCLKILHSLAIVGLLLRSPVTLRGRKQKHFFPCCCKNSTFLFLSLPTASSTSSLNLTFDFGFDLGNKCMIFHIQHSSSSLNFTSSTSAKARLSASSTSNVEDENAPKKNRRKMGLNHLKALTESSCQFLQLHLLPLPHLVNLRLGSRLLFQHTSLLLFCFGLLLQPKFDIFKSDDWFLTKFPTSIWPPFLSI